MVYASARLPFENVEEDAEWVMWQAQAPLYFYLRDKETDGRYADVEISCEGTEYADEGNYPMTAPLVHRNQYNAVLNRFDLASKRAGSFSAWNT